MRDEQNGHPGLGKPAQHVEQLFGFLRRENRSRLVHDQQRRILKQAAHDLDTLLFADGQVVDPRVRIDADAIFGRHGAHTFGQILERFAWRQRQRDILGDGQRLKQREMLEHHADPKLAGMLRAADGHRFSAPDDLARIGLQQPVDHFHEGGFSGTVLAEKRMDFSGLDLESNIVICREVPKMLADSGCGEKRCSGRRFVWPLRSGHSCL